MTVILSIDDPEVLEEISAMEDERVFFKASDKNVDNKLSQEEFLTFTHPNIGMIYPVLSATLKAKDQNKDGKINHQELISDCESKQSIEWVNFEKERFDDELDLNSDGFLNPSEILAWLMPENIQWNILLFSKKYLAIKGLFG